MAVLEVFGLRVSYGQREVVRALDAAFYPGLTVLAGPSGCGKSTVLRAITRTLPMQAQVQGRIVLDGQDTAALDNQSLRRRVGMVWQRPWIFPGSIAANVGFAPRARGVRGAALAAAVEQALRSAALWDEVGSRLREPAAGLSGGQQQRLCIARALAAGPEVLLLDEPTSALDPAASAQIEALLVRLRRQMTLVLVTHNPAQASRLADFTVTLHPMV